MSQILEIPIDSVLPNPEQPRKTFDPTDLQGLAKSLTQQGLIQPIVVEAAGEQYILEDGERRLRAAKIAGWSTIPAIVNQSRNGYGNRDRLVRALVANLQRADLNPIDEGLSFRRLMEMESLSGLQVAQELGISYARVLSRLALLEYDPPIQNLVRKGKLPSDVRVTKAIQAIPDSEARIKLANQAVAGNYSIKVILAAASKIEKTLRPGKEEPLVDTPSVAQGLIRARRSLDLPAWDALVQAGKTVPWSVVEESARRTCDRCNLRSLASADTCRECPLPQAIASMVDLAMMDKSQGARSVPLNKKVQK